MCVQFFQNTDLALLAAFYDAMVPKPFVSKGHIFPRYLSAVLKLEDGRRTIAPMHFGLVPFFEKSPKPKKVFHNARIETLTEKVSFRKPFAEARCLIPLDSFLEYIWTSETEKWLARFYPQDGKVLTAAAIWNAWKSPDGKLFHTYALLTGEPPPFIQKTGHDRSPIFLNPEAWDAWLSEGRKPYPELYRLLEKRAPVDWKVEKL